MATTAGPRKNQRLDFRVPAEMKAVIEDAAKLCGCSTSEFVLSRAFAAAEETLTRHTILHVSRRDSERFYAALANPPEPSDVMRNAARQHAESVKVDW